MTGVQTCALPILTGLAAHTAAVDIIAHRGASHDAPENTLAAFKLGWAQRADAVELDIWLTKDGKIIVCHDGEVVGGVLHPDVVEAAGRRERWHLLHIRLNA